MSYRHLTCSILFASLLLSGCQTTATDAKQPQGSLGDNTDAANTSDTGDKNEADNSIGSSDSSESDSNTGTGNDTDINPQILSPGKASITVISTKHELTEGETKLAIRWVNYGNEAKYWRYYINDVFAVSSVAYVASNGVQSFEYESSVTEIGEYELQVELCNHATDNRYCTLSDKIKVSITLPAVNDQPEVTLATLTAPSQGTVLFDTVQFESDNPLRQWLYIGSTAGAKDLYNSEFDGAVSVNGIPQDGSAIFVTLWSQVGDDWRKNSYEFITANLQVEDNMQDTTSKQKVLVVGLDGVQFEKIAQTSTPYIDALNITRAYAGGIPDTSSQQQTYSGPGWSSLLTGVWADQHKITSNNSGQADYASVLERLENNINPIYSASIWNWPNPNNQFFASDKNVTDIHMQNLSDEQVISESEDLIKNQGYDFVFAALDEADHIGHAEGFSQNYLNTISLLDSQLGKLMSAVKNREQQFNEDWLVLVVTDHGRAGSGVSHGGDSEQERTVFIASNKTLLQTCSSNQSLLECPSQVDITPTILDHMGVVIDKTWNLQGSSLFAEATDNTDGMNNTDNTDISDADSDVTSYRHWAIGGPSQILIPSSGIDGLTTSNGKNVAHLRARINSGSYTEMSVPLNPYSSGDPYLDPAVDLSNTQSDYVKITYQSNHDAILQLRQSGVHGGSHNQASLPASPNGFTSVTLSLANDFKWLGQSTSTLDLSRLGKFNFAFLSQNNQDGFAEIIVSGLEIENYQPGN